MWLAAWKLRASLRKRPTLWRPWAERSKTAAKCTSGRWTMERQSRVDRLIITSIRSALAPRFLLQPNRFNDHGFINGLAHVVHGQGDDANCREGFHLNAGA